MSKQITNTRFNAFAGVSMEDRERAMETIHAIKTTLKTVSNRGESKMFFNLPAGMFTKALHAFSAGSSGLLTEQYIARNLGNVRFTRTNEAHKGDLTDGKGKKYEVKTARPGKRKLINFSDIRPDDEVDAYLFGINDGEKVTVHEVTKKNLVHMPLYKKRNTRAKQMVFSSADSLEASVAKYSKVSVLDDSTTGQRWDSLRFLDEADVLIEDLEHLAVTKEIVRDKVAGIGTTAHVTLDELMAVRPLVQEGKFGLMVQDWLADHFEVAVARTPGVGDGVGRNSKMEMKYSSLNTQGRYTIAGLKPSEFDDLHIALRTGDDMEFFRLTKRSAASFVRRFGKETNTGIYRVSASAGGPAVSFLRKNKRNKALNPEMH